MFTSSEASDRLEVPPATLRRYTKVFAFHLSEETQRTRGRRYTEEDLGLLGKVRELLNNGLSYDEVHDALGTPIDARESYESEEDSDLEVSAESAAQAQQSGKLQLDDAIEPLKQELAALRKEIQELLLKQEQLEKSLREEKKSNVTRHALIENWQSRADEQHEVFEYRLSRLEEWLKMPWLRRLFSQPPTWGPQ